MDSTTIEWLNFILRQMEEAKVVLVLGAGATASSLNARGNGLKTASNLAKHLAEKANFTYEAESLADVVNAVQGVLGTERTNDLICEQYTNCTPSPDLERLFKFPWKRVYTFNVDDALEKIPRRSKTQEFRFKNALKDRVSEYGGISYCEVIHLNGSVTDPSSGFIFSAEEYSRSFSQMPPWYEKAGDDYVDHTVVFIGTSLQEPLLLSQIERAKSKALGKAGMSFTMVPETLSKITSQSLETQGIKHLPITVAEFGQYIIKKFPQGIMPKDVLAKTSGIVPDEIYNLSPKDVSALNCFKVIDKDRIAARARASKPKADAIGKQFFSGFPPTWDVVAADAFIKLDSYENITKFVQKRGRDEKPLFVALGDSGGGKTTGLMYAINQNVMRGTVPFVLEYEDSGRPLLEACHALSSLYKDNQITILIAPLNIYADELRSVLEHGGFKNLSFVASARVGEWNERLAKRLSNYASVFEMPRFDEKDVRPIINGLDKYLPSPKFASLSAREKEQTIRQARRQLLMLFKELSGGIRFDEIIAAEYQGLLEFEDRILFLSSGIASLARVGLPLSAARQIKRSVGSAEPVESSLDRLGTMVQLGPSGRINARHDLYVRHIIEQVADKVELREAIRLTGMYFSQFEAPVVRHVDRRDYQLFKYLLNEDNLRRIFHGKQGRSSIASIYEEFEVPFQRDGHFWLQYALFNRSIGEQKRAYELLEKSCQAYPENEYALHALCQQKLMLAADRKVSDHLTAARWIEEAVSELLKIDARQTDTGDDSAIWTLAKYHTKALRSLGRHEDAKVVARRYFEKLSIIEKSSSNPKISSARAAMLLLATVGEYTDNF